MITKFRNYGCGVLRINDKTHLGSRPRPAPMPAVFKDMQHSGFGELWRQDSRMVQHVAAYIK